MICPHCLVQITASFKPNYIGDDENTSWWVTSATCPNEECKELIIYLNKGEARRHQYGVNFGGINEKRLVWPKGIARKQLSSDIPENYNNDYKEASLVLADSPKASAALSRRCLQKLLLDREKELLAGGDKIIKDLSKQIQAVLDAGKYPPGLADSVDAIRNIGNFAAHPLKDTNSGEIIEVESGEAEWNLDVLDMLFDFYFVQPAIIKAKRDALNDKLVKAGKPKMR